MKTGRYLFHRKLAADTKQADEEEEEEEEDYDDDDDDNNNNNNNNNAPCHSPIHASFLPFC